MLRPRQSLLTGKKSGMEVKEVEKRVGKENTGLIWKGAGVRSPQTDAIAWLELLSLGPQETMQIFLQNKAVYYSSKLIRNSFSSTYNFFSK